MRLNPVEHPAALAAIRPDAAGQGAGEHHQEAGDQDAQEHERGLRSPPAFFILSIFLFVAKIEKNQ
jgi:hypothetical protein